MTSAHPAKEKNIAISCPETLAPESQAKQEGLIADCSVIFEVTFCA